MMTLKDSKTRADPMVYNGPTPQIGSEIDHHIDDEVMRLRITGIRPVMMREPTAQSIDLVDALEL
jgi:hypothetical protein